MKANKLPANTRSGEWRLVAVSGGNSWFIAIKSLTKHTYGNTHIKRNKENRVLPPLTATEQMFGGRQ